MLKTPLSKSELVTMPIKKLEVMAEEYFKNLSIDFIEACILGKAHQFMTDSKNTHLVLSRDDQPNIRPEIYTMTIFDGNNKRPTYRQWRLVLNSMELYGRYLISNNDDSGLIMEENVGFEELTVIRAIDTTIINNIPKDQEYRRYLKLFSQVQALQDFIKMMKNAIQADLDTNRASLDDELSWGPHEVGQAFFKEEREEKEYDRHQTSSKLMLLVDEIFRNLFPDDNLQMRHIPFCLILRPEMAIIAEYLSARILCAYHDDSKFSEPFSSINNTAFDPHVQHAYFQNRQLIEKRGQREKIVEEHMRHLDDLLYKWQSYNRYLIINSTIEKVFQDMDDKYAARMKWYYEGLADEILTWPLEARRLICEFPDMPMYYRIVVKRLSIMERRGLAWWPKEDSVGWPPVQNTTDAQSSEGEGSSIDEQTSQRRSASLEL